MLTMLCAQFLLGSFAIGEQMASRVWSDSLKRQTDVAALNGVGKTQAPREKRV